MKEVSVVQEFDFRQLVFAADGESVTKVFMIAKAYGKCLSDVIPAIEKGHASDEFRAAHFFAVDKINELGIFDKKQKYYRMNLSGFVMLVMGFSGAKAASIKEGDTNVFN